MRDREVNEKAALNTLFFLRELNERCDTGKLTAIGWLSKKHELSNNTGWACKKLNIVTVENGIYKWVPKAEPSRVMALQILDALLERSKAKIDPPAIPDLASNIETLTQKIGEASQSFIHASKRPLTGLLKRALGQSSMANNSLFAAADSKEAKRMEILDSVLIGLFMGKQPEDLTDAVIKKTAAAAVKVTDNVINKMYANQ